MPISLDWYLCTSLTPDYDYVDGDLIDRNVGEYAHASSMVEISVYLHSRYRRSEFVTANMRRVKVWLIDPHEPRAFIRTLEGSVESTDLVLRAHDCEIVLELNEVSGALQ